MADEDKSVPQEGQTEEKVPSTPEEGKTEEKENAPLQSVPDALKSKSPEDLAKMYVELERKIGAQGQELGDLRKFRQDAAVVVQAIYQNPEVKGAVEKELLKMQGVDPEEKKNGEPKEKVGLKDSDTRRAVEGQIMTEFEREKGLDALTPETRAQVYEAIGVELHSMLNPNGNKTIPQILDEVSLTNLKPMLDKAYRLARTNDEIAKATNEGMLKAQQNQAGAIGSIPSSGGVSSQGELSSEEREAARKLGISDEEYKKYKPSEELKV